MNELNPYVTDISVIKNQQANEQSMPFVEKALAVLAFVVVGLPTMLLVIWVAIVLFYLIFTPDPEFRYGDTVKVVAGVTEGQRGIVKSGDFDAVRCEWSYMVILESSGMEFENESNLVPYN